MIVSTVDVFALIPYFPCKTLGDMEPRPDEDDEWLPAVDVLLPEPIESGRGRDTPLWRLDTKGLGVFSIPTTSVKTKVTKFRWIGLIYCQINTVFLYCDVCLYSASPLFPQQKLKRIFPLAWEAKWINILSLIFCQWDQKNELNLKGKHVNFSTFQVHFVHSCCNSVLILIVGL